MADATAASLASVFEEQEEAWKINALIVDVSENERTSGIKEKGNRLCLLTRNNSSRAR